MFTGLLFVVSSFFSSPFEKIRILVHFQFYNLFLIFISTKPVEGSVSEGAAQMHQES